MTRSVSHMTRTVAGGSAERRQGSCHFLDIENKQACVDAAVSMDQLAQWMLPQGFLPPVITEFKGITVGGAVMGAALESSSFRYGQVSDVCTRFEFELADGQCVDLTPESDLFYGLSGSYGTIGRLKRVYLQVEPVQPWVELSARVCATEHVAEGLSASCTGDADFVDAMALDARRSVVMEGRYVASSSAQRIRFDRPWSKSFCQQVVEAAGRSKWSWSFTTYDYLFRYDLGAFWMGQFPTSRLAVTTFYNHRNDAPVEQARCLHQAFRESPPTLTPSGWLRMLLRAKLSSTHLYATLHRVSQEVLAHTFLVQDFYIPSDRVQEFLSYCHERVAIYPLWLCPMRGTATGQFLSPHYLHGASCFPRPDFINVGVYGVPKSGEDIPAMTHALELAANALGGRKMLYALNYYSEEEFWAVYDRERYDALRCAYGAESHPSLYQRTNSGSSRS